VKVGEGEQHVMQNRSIRRSGQPTCAASAPASAIGFRGDEIEMEILRVSSASEFSHRLDPELTSLIKAKFFVGAVGRGLVDPPGAQFPDHPQ
jgi:hypothetical protein